MDIDYPIVLETPRTKRIAKPLKVAIQGVQGEFHEIAARRFHAAEEVEVVPADTFDILIQQVESGEADSAVMAIENSIAGSILPNYSLLRNSELVIAGEIYLQIRQNLLVNPGITLKDIKEVHSHPIAPVALGAVLSCPLWLLIARANLLSWLILRSR